MGMNSGTKTVGGGKARGAADAFNTFLLNQLQNGTLGQAFNGQQSGANNGSQAFNPLTYQQQNFDTSGQASMNNPLFGAMGDMLQRNTQQGVTDLRGRFGMGGAPRGSNAAIAEGNFLAQSNPQNMLAMNQLGNSMRDQSRMDLGMGSQDMLARMGMAMQQNQFGQSIDMQKLGMLFGGLQQANQLGTPGAQTVQTPSPFSQGMGALAGIAPFALAPATGGASLGLGGMFGGGGGGQASPMQMSRPAQWTPPVMNWSYPGMR